MVKFESQGILISQRKNFDKANFKLKIFEPYLSRVFLIPEKRIDRSINILFHSLVHSKGTNLDIFQIFFYENMRFSEVGK